MGRLFLAVLFPPPVATALEDVFTPEERMSLLEAGVMRSWVPRPALHCTLQFYGEVPEGPLVEQLEAVADRSAPASARIGGDTRVLGRDALIVPVRGLDVLAGNVRAALGGHVAAGGIRRSDRFYGHATIGRLANRAPAAAVTGRAAPRAGWRVQELHLMESRGGRYRTVMTVALRDD